MLGITNNQFSMLNSHKGCQCPLPSATMRLMKRYFGFILSVVFGLLAVCGARADGADDQYIVIFNLVQEADSLSGNEPAQALAKYLEAQTELQRLQKGNPTWNPRLVNFRLNYLTTKIAAVSAKAPPPTAAPAAASAPAPAAANQSAPNPSAASAPIAKPAPPAEWENQVNSLKAQVRQLQADKTVLEAKLKEALSVQPAAVDPRELAKAEERIKALQKENDLLKLSLQQEKSKPAPEADTKALEQARRELTEANRKLAELIQQAKTLTVEKDALQSKLDNLPASAWNATNIEKAKKELEDAKRQLAEQKDLAGKLAVEKESLQARIKAMTSESDATKALRAENALLKKQLADLHAAPAPTTKPAKAARQLAESRAQLAALQSDKEMLRLENKALRDRVTQLVATATNTTATVAVTAPAPPPAPAPAPAPAPSVDTERLKQLERERDDLQKRLAAANKDLAARKDNAAATVRVVELEKQLAAVRARLDVFEAHPVPYNAEEVALFKAPEPKLAKVEAPAADAKPVQESPKGTAQLVAEAQRYFATHQLDKAEESYLQVLHQDQKSVPALANLAAIQLELNHLETAEMNVKQALALAPDDAFSLSILGYLKFRQGKYDEAVDHLSRAAKLDPSNAEIQNYLGLALSEKGLRGPAETALRKAIQLQPNYGSAHNNLAVIYVTQQPPLAELARYHYQKALAAGLAPNAELEKLINAKK
jgi:tetratricopeptide (TPR) repeat protein